MSNNHKYFSDSHASRDSQFLNLPDDTKDSPETLELRQKVKKDPENPELLTGLAAALSFQLRYREAIKAFDKALNLSPDSLNARLGRASCYYKTLQLEKAYKEYKILSGMAPYDIRAQYRLAIASYALGRNAQAASCFTKAIEGFEGDPEMLAAAHYWLLLSEARLKTESGKWQRVSFEGG